MNLELFAQFVRNNKGNDPAFQAGVVAGMIFAAIVCSAIPIAVGATRGHPIIGVIGGICAIPAALLLGCLGGLPVAAVFVVIILVMGKETAPRRRKRKRVREYEDDYDDDDEEEDDRPRTRRKRTDYDDDEEEDDDRPRRRRRYD
jgi:hypothetical protein